jgi:hypothetical protein
MCSLAHPAGVLRSHGSLYVARVETLIHAARLRKRARLLNLSRRLRAKSFSFPKSRRITMFAFLHRYPDLTPLRVAELFRDR